MLTMPTLNDSEIDLIREGRRSRAMIDYRARVTLSIDGRMFRPTLIGARRVVELFLSDLGLPLAVSEELVFDVAEAEEADRQKRERFEARLRAEEIPVGFPYERASTSIGSCDLCGAKGDPVLHGVYALAPDAWGTPTPVLFECYACHGPLVVLPTTFDRGEG